MCDTESVNHFHSECEVLVRTGIIVQSVAKIQIRLGMFDYKAFLYFSNLGTRVVLVTGTVLPGQIYL